MMCAVKRIRNDRKTLRLLGPEKEKKQLKTRQSRSLLASPLLWKAVEKAEARSR